MAANEPIGICIPSAGSEQQLLQRTHTHISQMDPTGNDAHFGARHPSQTEAQKMLDEFWGKELKAIQEMNHNDFRNPELPLARIKKIMKLDEDVKMISGEAPVLFAKAVEIFIAELSLRAWINTEDNKRRTLQRNDIAMGISKYDQFDFLIDIVPREEAKPAKKPENNANIISQDQLNYFFQLSQQQQLQGGTGQPIQIIQTANQNQQFTISPQLFQLPSGQNQEGSTVMSTSQVVQLNHASAEGTQTTANNEKGNLPTTTPLILSNIYNNNGEIQQLPITLSSQQYQTLIQNQQNSGQNQQIIISNPQSLSMPTHQFITNTGQVVQAIIPTSNNMDQMNSNKLPTQTDESGES